MQKSKQDLRMILGLRGRSCIWPQLSESRAFALGYQSEGEIMSYYLENSDPHSCWYAAWTRSRQEKTAATMLATLGISHFLPLKSEFRQWSDRKQAVSVPLFNGYVFVRINPTNDNRLQILKTPGIVGLVGNQTGPLPIPDQQIEDIRTVLIKRADCTVHPLLEEGEQVRVVRGPLAGMEGRLIRSNSSSRLVISIEMIHKSLAVNVSREDVELVRQHAA
jgi:transcription termination/antitermination protein NusG